jgi:hypothetical protein
VSSATWIEAISFADRSIAEAAGLWRSCGPNRSHRGLRHARFGATNLAADAAPLDCVGINDLATSGHDALRSSHILGGL